jgi:hypothetical protein
MSTRRLASIVAAGALAVTPVVAVVGVGSASASTPGKARHGRAPVARAASCIDESWTSTGSPLWIRQGEGTAYRLATNGHYPNGAGFPNGSRFHGQCTGTGWLYVTSNGDYPTGYVNAAYAH